MKMKNGTVELENGLMDYVSFGSGGKTLIVLPGLSDGLTTVRGKAVLLGGPYKRFADRYTVYMFSRRRSLPQGSTMEDMAEDQAEALKVLGIQNTSVLGVSQGGMIAQCLAAQNPGMIDKMVLTVTAPHINELLSENLDRWIGFAEKGKHADLMIDTAERSYSEVYLKKYRRLYPLLGHVGKPKDYERFLINARAIQQFTGTSLQNIVCPVLIIGGSEDGIVGVQASSELHEKIQGSELYVYEGLSHGLYEEAPDFYERVFRFLEDNE